MSTIVASLVTSSMGLDLILKATLILTIALILMRALGRRIPALAVSVGHTALVALWLLPISVALVPAIKLPFLAPAQSQTEFVSQGNPEIFEKSHDSVMEIPENHPLKQGSVKPSSVTRDTASTTTPVLVSSPAVSESRSQTPAPSTTAQQSFDTSRLLSRIIVFYLVGTLIFLIRWSLSIRSVARVRRQSRPVVNPAWGEALERIRTALGIPRPVLLGWSSSVGVPVVLGWRQPMILIPDALENVDPTICAEAILSHELAHVRRHDYPWNVFLRFTVSVLWFHPLAWQLSRQIGEARERVCDEFSVYQLGGVSHYVEILIEVATRNMVRLRPPAVGLAMARSSRLARRIDRLSHTSGSPNCLAARPVRSVLALVGTVAAVALGSLQISRAEAPTPLPQKRDDAVSVKAQVPRPAVKTSEKPETATKTTTSKLKPRPTPDRTPRTMLLKVVNAENGRPVPRAQVRLWIDMDSLWKTTDDQGQLAITHGTTETNSWFAADVWGDGFAMQRHAWNRTTKPFPTEATIKLKRGVELGGKVQDDQGRPIAGAVMLISAGSGAIKKNDPAEALYELRVVSGPDGRWKTRGAPEPTGDTLQLRIYHPDFISVRYAYKPEMQLKVAEARAGTSVTVLRKGIPIEGRVRDPNGQPIAGARVLGFPPNLSGSLFFKEDIDQVFTDADGRFRLGQVEPGSMNVVVFAKGHAVERQQIEIGTDVPQLQFQLKPSKIFKGRIVDQWGQPIQGVSISFENWQGFRCLGGYDSTDADGRFEWTSVPDDAFVMKAICSEYLSKTYIPVEDASQPLTIVLPEMLGITAKVTDHAGKPVLQAQVDYGEADPNTGEVKVWMPLRELGAGLYDGRLNAFFPAEAETYKVRIRVLGYEPFITRMIRRGDPSEPNVEIRLKLLNQKKPLRVTVLKPDGRPLPDANIDIIWQGGRIRYQTGQLPRFDHVNGLEIHTRADGTAELPTSDQPYAVLVISESSYALTNQSTLEKTPIIKTLPFARITGRYFVGQRPVPRQELQLHGFQQSRSTEQNLFSVNGMATTDDEGRFTIDRVIPLPQMRIRRMDSPRSSNWVRSIGEPITLQPGQTSEVQIGGKGRSVIGRVKLPVDWNEPFNFSENASASIVTRAPGYPYPLELIRNEIAYTDRISRWSEEWKESPEGVAFLNSRVNVSVALASDGSFRIDDLLAGDYRLTLHVGEEENFRAVKGPFARAGLEFTIPAIQGQRESSPLDLGTIPIKRRIEFKVGDKAPDLEFKTIDGESIKLADLKGKYTLLDLGAPWSDQSRFQVYRLNALVSKYPNNVLTRLNAIRATYPEQDRLAIVSLIFATDTPATRAFIAEKGQPWPQAIVGPYSNPISEAFNLSDYDIPAAILIAPDGRVAAIDHGGRIEGGAVLKVLESKIKKR